ncbi:MarR family transcriptional regulator [Salinifilum aidingensis]
MDQRRDFVDVVRAQWAQVRPDLDTTSIDLVGRILRAATVLRNQLDAAISGDGLNRAEFDLLSALRRSPGPITPGELTKQTTSSAAATTKRLQQLVERGLLERMVDARDRRSAQIALTEHGRELIDRVMSRNLEAERHLVEHLDPDTRNAVGDGLAQLLSAIEDPSATAALTAQLQRRTEEGAGADGAPPADPGGAVSR